MAARVAAIILGRIHDSSEQRIPFLTFLINGKKQILPDFVGPYLHGVDCVGPRFAVKSPVIG